MDETLSIYLNQNLNEKYIVLDKISKFKHFHSQIIEELPENLNKNVSVYLLFKTVTSTQTLMASDFSFLPLNAVLRAERQTGGIGRKSNRWESPVGCLMFSFKIQLRCLKLFSVLQFFVSLILAKAILNTSTFRVLYFRKNIFSAKCVNFIMNT